MSMQQPEKGQQIEPVFVVGMNGSGTTMLADSLGMHPDLYMFPNEVRLLPYLASRPHGWGDLSQLASRRRLARKLGDAKSFWHANGRSRFEVGDEYLREPGFAATIDGVFRAFARRAGKHRWGEKSPMNVAHMELLAQVFPRARFVHIVRDARDAAQSFHRRYGFVPAETVYRWKRVVALARQQATGLAPERYLEVRYEELTADPQAWMQQVCSFLGLSFDPVVLQSTMRMVDPQVAATSEARIMQNSGKWASYFSRSEIEHMERLAGRELADHGYSVAMTGDDEPGWFTRACWRSWGVCRRTWLHFRRWGWKGLVGYMKSALVAVKESRAGRL